MSGMLSMLRSLLVPAKMATSSSLLSAVTATTAGIVSRTVQAPSSLLRRFYYSGGRKKTLQQQKEAGEFPWIPEDCNNFTYLKKRHVEGVWVRPKRLHPMGDQPFMRGIVIKTLVRHPKKPNSANRKCVLVRLSNGREAIAFVPGVGHNLTEHSVVLCVPRRTPDVPGLRTRVVRGKYDCAKPIKNSAGM